MNIIDVTSSITSYPVYIGSSSFDMVPAIISNKRCFIITDENVMKYHKRFLLKLFAKEDYYIHIIKPGEKSKSLNNVSKILERIKLLQLTRDSIIIAFGGGVVGDIAGFIASIYMRGIKYIQIPTTLLACVDSSVGGKTGVNFKGIKNLVGSFYNPSAVLINSRFLSSLPDDEFISGMGEVIKYKFLIGGDFYKKELSVNKDSENELNEIINECIRFKASVVAEDERDNGLRKILNLGHTFAHGYESASNYRIKHGEAVVMGVISSFFLAFLNGIISEDQLKEYSYVVKSNFSKVKQVKAEAVLQALKLDKKSLEGELNFIVVKEPGKILMDFHSDRAIIKEAIKDSLSYMNG